MSKKINDQELIGGFGKKLGFLLASMNISDDAKELFIEILNNLPPEKVAEVAMTLENKFASEQLDLLNIELENKLEQLAIEYAEKEKKIDEKTITELDSIFKRSKK
ncbi:MAG TPA: hypothetical protein PLD95_00645 [bacterium]|jgi:hypothetical protein|nr:hypothetical protein [bacterium]HOG37961.1 hypothetical protein [bacterium]HQI03020.1 hypothetical protein [bacterium]